MIVFDTEDDSAELLSKPGGSGFDKTVTQIAAICDNGKRFHNSGNVREFLNWCHKMPPGGVWSFNTQYDIGNLCHEGSCLRLDDFDMTLVKGRFIKATLEGLNFYDVHNLSGAGSSVKTLGESVGLKKLDGAASGYRDKDYVFRDCEIPMKWLKFVGEKCAELGLAKIPATLGGLCVSAFAAGGNFNWFNSDEKSRSGLSGARVELFSGGGKGRIAYCDLNSLYPWSMTQNFPTAFEKLDDGLNGYGLAECVVQVPKSFIAPLPVKDNEGRMIFPTGKFGGVWTLAELRNAVRAGAKILKIKWAYGSADGEAYYRAYILDMYQRRLRSRSGAENLFWKLCMNNLYGRLAISGKVSRTLNLTDANKNKGGLPYGRKILSEQKMPLPNFTNYLHAAHVLSYGRIRLFEHLIKIPQKDLIYCDTDSIIFFCEGELPFPITKELGGMKLEAWGKECIPYLPKMYRFDEQFKAKGVPKKMAKEFIETGAAEFDLPFKLREAIHFYDAENSHKLSVWRKVKRERAAEYDKKQKKGFFYLPKVLNLA